MELTAQESRNNKDPINTLKAGYKLYHESLLNLGFLGLINYQTPRALGIAVITLKMCNLQIKDMGDDEIKKCIAQEKYESILEYCNTLESAAAREKISWYYWFDCATFCLFSRYGQEKIIEETVKLISPLTRIRKLLENVA
jgi:hypothetical protein